MECRSPSRPAQHLSMGGLLSGKGCREQRLFSVLRRNLNAFHSPSYLPFTLGTHTCGLGPGHLAREGGRAMLRAHPACTVRALLLPWTRLSRVCLHASDSAPLGPQSRKGPVPQGFAAHSPCPSHTAGSISGPLRMAPVWGRLEMGASLSVPQALDLACLRRGSAPHLLHPCSSRTRGGHPASPHQGKAIWTPHLRGRGPWLCTCSLCLWPELRPLVGGLPQTLGCRLSPLSLCMLVCTPRTLWCSSAPKGPGSSFCRP